MALRFDEPARDAYRFPLTIRHLLDNVLTTSPDQEIIYRDEVRLTYRDFVGRVARLASLLEGLGVEQGMTVAVMDWDSHRYLEAYFAVPMMGAVLQTVNVRLPATQIAYTLQHAQAQVLLVHHDFFPLVDALLPASPGIKAVVAIMDGSAAPLPPFACGEYEALSAAAPPNFAFQDFDENAVATTFYTTGTTGNPKGVCFTHRQLVLHTLVCNAPFGVAAGTGIGYRDVYMPLTPMFHVHAWGAPYVATLLGVKQVYPGRYDPDLICRLRAEHGVTYSHCVPTILRMVLDAAERNGGDLAGWMVKVGGAALTPALCAEGRARGMNIVAGYGMSETAPLVSLGRTRIGAEGDETATIAALTATVPAPMVSTRIVDEHMADVRHDGMTRGELVLRAPWLTQCYTGDAAASAELWRGGWMHTQDLATIDADGNIRIRDRLKDVIKTGGEWIDSLLLDELVATSQGVAEAAVVAAPDGNWGERPAAVVVALPGHAPTLAMLNAPIDAAIAAGQLSRYARLDRFLVVEQLPRTSVGKIDKKQLRNRFVAEPPTTVHPTAPIVGKPQTVP